MSGGHSSGAVLQDPRREICATNTDWGAINSQSLTSWGDLPGDLPGEGDGEGLGSTQESLAILMAPLRWENHEFIGNNMLTGCLFQQHIIDQVQEKGSRHFKQTRWVWQRVVKEGSGNYWQMSNWNNRWQTLSCIMKEVMLDGSWNMSVGPRRLYRSNSKCSSSIWVKRRELYTGGRNQDWNVHVSGFLKYTFEWWLGWG